MHICVINAVGAFGSASLHRKICIYRQTTACAVTRFVLCVFFRSRVVNTEGGLFDKTKSYMYTRVNNMYVYVYASYVYICFCMYGL